MQKFIKEYQILIGFIIMSFLIGLGIYFKKNPDSSNFNKAFAFETKGSSKIPIKGFPGRDGKLYVVMSNGDVCLTTDGENYSKVTDMENACRQMWYPLIVYKEPLKNFCNVKISSAIDPYSSCGTINAVITYQNKMQYVYNGRVDSDSLDKLSFKLVE